MHAHSCVFSTGELVYARNFHPGKAYLPGYIVKTNVTVSTSFLVKLKDGCVLKHHLDNAYLKIPFGSGTVGATREFDTKGLFTEKDIAVQTSPPEAVEHQFMFQLLQVTDLPSSCVPVSSAQSPCVPQPSTPCYPSHT